MFLQQSIQQVIHYEEDTFVEDSQQKPLMIKFYADYCGHCKHLAPIYQNLSEDVSQINFGEIECPSHRIICGKYKIKGFPTLLLFKDNMTYEYEGARNEINMKNWIDLFDKPLFVRDQSQNLTDLSQNYSFDHYYQIKVKDCDDFENQLAMLKGQAIIFCKNINQDEKEQFSVTFFKQNQTYNEQNEQYTSYDIQKLVYYYNTELFTRISTQHFQQCIRLGGILFTYTKNTKHTGEIQALLKQQAKQQNIKVHYGMLFKEGQYSEIIIKKQLQLNLTEDQIIYFDTSNKPFKLYSYPFNVEENIAQQYETFINNLDTYEKPYNPISRQNKKANSKMDPRALVMIVTLTIIIIMITTICICDYNDKKLIEQQQKLIEESVRQAEMKKQIEYQKLIQCQEETQEDEQEQDLLSLNQIDKQLNNE